MQNFRCVICVVGNVSFSFAVDSGNQSVNEYDNHELLKEIGAYFVHLYADIKPWFHVKIKLF